MKSKSITKFAEDLHVIWLFFVTPRLHRPLFPLDLWPAAKAATGLQRKKGNASIFWEGEHLCGYVLIES